MSSLNEQDRADLVAYLDGELDEPRAHQLEAKLNLDPEARAEADALKQAWGLLDYLPKAEPSPSFTNRTMERLALAKSRATQTQIATDLRPTYPRLKLVVIVLKIFAAFGLGLFLPTFWRSPKSIVEESVVTLSDREWMLRQPRSLMLAWEKLEGEEAVAFVRKLREHESLQKQEWKLASRFWKELESKKPLPCRLSDLPNEVQIYVNEGLKPLLTKAEREQLDQAEGSWPSYPTKLVELADRHPLALMSPDGPRRYSELPKVVQKLIQKKGIVPKTIERAEGKWPDFAIAITELSKKREITLPKELWPHHFQDLLKPMQDFVNQKLQPLLTNDEKLTLLHSEGKWPDYPETIQKLATDHHLRAPWHNLPGNREEWDQYRFE